MAKTISIEKHVFEPRKFVIGWILSQLLYWIAALIIALILSLAQFLGFLILPLLIGAVIFFGLGIGKLQRHFLRAYLAWEIPNWHSRTLVGGISGIFASLFASMLFIGEVLENDFAPTPRLSSGEEDLYILIGCTVGLVTFYVFVAFAQLSPLWKSIRHAWLWLVVNLVSGLIIALFFYMANVFPSNLRSAAEESTNIPLALVGILLSALLNALTLLWFSQRRGKLKRKEQG